MKSSRILVTGASGFLGTHLVTKLAKDGCEVYALVRSIKTETHKNGTTTIICDLRDKDALKKTVKEINPDKVFHLAAKIKSDPQDIFDSNLMGTLNLLDSLIDSNCKKIVNISTSDVYGNQKSSKVKESDSPKPVNLYGASKLAAEIVALSYYSHYGMPLTILRPFLIYGPNQNSNKMLIPYTIVSLLKGKFVETTQGKQIRDPVFIDDVIEAIVVASGKKSVVGETINIGTGKGWKIKEILNAIAKLMQAPQEKLAIGKLRYSENEVWNLVADNKKAKRILGWKAKTSLEDGLGKTIQWYRKNIHLVV